jgi:transcriptional antiterminator RfaH
MNSSDKETSKQRGMKWYVIRTEPQADYLADGELRRAGFEIFSPRVQIVSSRKEGQLTPLFPGYLFLRWDLEDSGKPSFQDAPHVSGWVNFNGLAPPVPDEVVTQLVDRVEAINNEGGLWRRFKAGERVRIVSNVVETFGEVVEETKSPQSRVKVLIEFMGRRVTVQVPWENLQPAEEKPGVETRSPRRTRGRGRWIRGFGQRSIQSV